jgi:ADP-L-glycero-D-manno-heptose 6-epimerase
MIIITGAGGFIGSVVLGYLNSKGIENIILVDDLPFDGQYKNLIGKKYKKIYSTNDLTFNEDISAVIHIGANANTLEKNWIDLYNVNIKSTRFWNEFCLKKNIPFIFTSSAAIYGNGYGPLNQYAFSKYSVESEITGVILRLFNVYGPNEYHKGRMASTIYHWYHQLNKNNTIKIFEGSKDYFRDFIYVEDVAKIVVFFLKNYIPGIYDVGTGSAVSFDTISDTVLSINGAGKKELIPMPQDLESQYQKNTEANLEKLKLAGYDTASVVDTTEGIKQYFEFLNTNKYY